MRNQPTEAEKMLWNVLSDKGIDKYKFRRQHIIGNYITDFICLKTNLIIKLILDGNWKQVLVFTRTKHGANKLCKKMLEAGITASAIHGNKSQGARTKALAGFKSGTVSVLVATDIAARGLDIPLLPHVVNFELPNISEDYVHRIGRTGRASASGIALSFCNGEEKPYLKDIQKLINQSIPVIDNHPFPDDGTEVFVKAPQQQRRPKTERGNSSGNRSGNGGNKAGNSGGNNNKRFGAKRN